jgi:threonyl-tRNA synthetase
MPKFTRTEVYNPEGRLVWTGAENNKSQAIEFIPLEERTPCLLRALGQHPSTHQVTAGKIFSTAKELGFFDDKGCPDGFVVKLPRGTHFDRCLNKYNESFLRNLNWIQVDFPLMFDSSDPEMAELISGYEKQNRLFAVDASPLKLSYAADSGLFPWLKNRIVKLENDPLTIVSDTTYVRKWQSGETNGFNRMHQFSFPDLHTLTSPEKAESAYLKLVELGNVGMNFWLQNQRYFFTDVEENFSKKRPEFVKNLSLVSGCWSIFNYFSDRPRYYAARSGHMADGGYGNIMLYNYQWDDTNAARFNIRLADSNIEPIIIHSTLMGGTPRLLPVILGRALNGQCPKVIPPELDMNSISFLAISQSGHSLCEEMISHLKSHGIPARVLPLYSDRKFSISKAIGSVIEQWVPYYSVVGDKETSNRLVQVQARPQGPKFEFSEWLNLVKNRISICAPTQLQKLNSIQFGDQK